MADWKLDDSQLKTWQGLDEARDLKTKVDGTKPKTKVSSPPVPALPDLPFYPATSFPSLQAGLCFTLGDDGVGYYADTIRSKTSNTCCLLISLARLVPVSNSGDAYMQYPLGTLTSPLPSHIGRDGIHKAGVGHRDIYYSHTCAGKAARQSSLVDGSCRRPQKRQFIGPSSPLS